MKKPFFILVSGAALLFALSLFCSRHLLFTSRYTYETARVQGIIKAVHLSDLHGYTFGRENERLVKKIERERPDVIFMTGDMMNDDDEDTESLERLIRRLKAVAPVYYSLGNHEKTYMEGTGKDALIMRLEAAGAVVLEQECWDTIDR